MFKELIFVPREFSLNSMNQLACVCDKI